MAREVACERSGDERKHLVIFLRVQQSKKFTRTELYRFFRYVSANANVIVSANSTNANVTDLNVNHLLSR